MARFNRTTTQPAPVAGTIRSELKPSERSALGGVGYVRDPQSELLLLGATNMVSFNTHHEDALVRDTRYATLIKQVSELDDGLGWLASFFLWLRTKANMRTAPFVGAAHLVAARRGMPDALGLVRLAVSNSLGRADEPGELVSFWNATYGGTLPKPLKRGIAMALPRLYTERAVLKWDTAGKAFRFGRILDLTHPTMEDIQRVAQHRQTGRVTSPVRPGRFVEETSILFGYLGHRFRGEAVETPLDLKMMLARQGLMEVPQDQRAAMLEPGKNGSALFYSSGMDWQAAASWYGRALDANFWHAMIPNMGVQALLMNLRNFDRAGISASDIDLVCSILEDSVKVTRSQIMPTQVLASYRATSPFSDNWSKAQSRALDHSLENVPVLDGNTLIMIDTSTSMNDKLSEKSELMRWDAAVIFGLAIARRATAATVVSFSSMQKFYGDPRGPKTKTFPVAPGESLLKSIERWKTGDFFLGGGTETAAALRKEWREFGGRFTRVLIITDEQQGEDPIEVSNSIPSKVPMVTMNLAGYRTGHAPAGTRTRIALGGLNDAAFAALASVDKFSQGRWPWEADRGAAA